MKIRHHGINQLIMASPHPIFNPLHDDFPPFEDIHVGKATRIVGETSTQFLLKTSYKGVQPLLVQTPQGLWKQGFQKQTSVGGTKKWASDLVFSVASSEFYDWMDKMESFCVDYLFRHQKHCFQKDLSTEDVENLFVSPCKIFKSSKTYQLRCTVSDLGQSLQIFDADKKKVAYDETYHTDQPLLGIVELVGIRCSQKHFQLELEWKQGLLRTVQNKDVEPVLLIQEETLSSEPTTTTSTTTTTTLASSKVDVETTVVDSSTVDVETTVLESSMVEEENILERGLMEVEDIYKRVLEKAKMVRDLGVLNYLEGRNIGNVQLFLDATEES
jgi:hypothetical protein